MSYPHQPPSDCQYAADSLRLEAVTVSVGFDDLLDITLGLNHPHLDTQIVVTSHEDHLTHKVARKHGAILVQTDLFHKNGRRFNKGAAINAGFNHFQFFGWRAHVDADTVLPDNCRRLLFNHTPLDQQCIYGADRTNVVGKDELDALVNPSHPRHRQVKGHSHRPIYKRYFDAHDDYCPIGYFQLWHARAHKGYPYSLGTAAHDDTMFSAQWPQRHRRLLPTGICHHICAVEPTVGENWDGDRRQPRIDA